MYIPPSDLRHADAPPAPLWRVVLRDGLSAILGPLMAIGGLWLAISGTTMKDRLAGVVGVLLFGFAGYQGIVGIARARTNGPQVLGPDGLPRPSFWGRLAPYLPLLAMVGTGPWAVLVIVGFIFVVGDSRFESTPEKERLFQFVIALPAIVGLIGGVIILLMGMVRTGTQRVCFALGSAGCISLLVAVMSGWVR